MGPLLLPVLAFILWEFPSMVMQAVHKLICALTGGSFSIQMLGIWLYRLTGILIYWTTIVLTAT